MGGAKSMEAEARVLRAAAEAGVPVAPVVAASDDVAIAGSPVPHHGSGRGRDHRPATAARRRVRGGPIPSRRPVRGRVGGHPRGARVGHHPPRGAGADQPDPRPHRHARSAPSRVRARPALARAASAAGRRAHAWCTATSGSATSWSTRTACAAVLDWELAHLGDPIEDLGWLCVRAWRFGSDLPVAGVGDYAELLAAYESASGREVDPDVAALVGGARHAAVGGDLRDAGRDPPHGCHPLGRAGRHRPPGLRERVRPPRPHRRPPGCGRGVVERRRPVPPVADLHGEPTASNSSRRCASSSRAT